MAAVQETRASHADATQALWSQYHASVYRYALSQLRSPQDAEDATQNTFLRAFNALARGVVPENEAAWIFKIAHNTCKSSKLAWLRRRRVETPHDIATLDAPAVDRRHDELAGLGDALAAMPARPREAFLLREWRGLSYAEIAAQMNTSQSAVETLIFRARRTLAEQLDQPLRRARQALGLGPLFGMLRGWLGGGSLAVKAAGAAAVIATATVASTQVVHHAGGGGQHRQPAPAVHTPVLAPAPAQPIAHSPAAQRPAAKHHQATASTPSQPAAPAAPAPAPTPVPAPASTPAATPAQASPTGGVTPPALPNPPSLPAVPPAASEPVLPSVPDVPAAPAVPTLPAAPSPPAVPPPPALPALPALPPIPAAPAVPEPPHLP